MGTWLQSSATPASSPRPSLLPISPYWPWHPSILTLVPSIPLLSPRPFLLTSDPSLPSLYLKEHDGDGPNFAQPAEFSTRVQLGDDILVGVHPVDDLLFLRDLAQLRQPCVVERW